MNLKEHYTSPLLSELNLLILYEFKYTGSTGSLLMKWTFSNLASSRPSISQKTRSGIYLISLPVAPVFPWKAVNHSSGRNPNRTGGAEIGRVRRGKLTKSRSGPSCMTTGPLLVKTLAVDNGAVEERPQMKQWPEFRVPEIRQHINQKLRDENRMGQWRSVIYRRWGPNARTSWKENQVEEIKEEGERSTHVNNTHGMAAEMDEGSEVKGD